MHSHLCWLRNSVEQPIHEELIWRTFSPCLKIYLPHADGRRGFSFNIKSYQDRPWLICEGLQTTILKLHVFYDVSQQRRQNAFHRILPKQLVPLTPSANIWSQWRGN